MAIAGITPDEGPYKLHAYVLNGHVIRMSPFGRVTFTRIYQNRPKEARYAVAGHYSVELHADRFIAWDLFNVLKDPNSGLAAEPKPRLTHTDLDAAIMATVLLYNDGGK